MGSMDAARWAGRYDARTAVKKRITATEMITERSMAETPYNVVLMARPTNAEPAKPITRPITARTDASFRISQITRCLPEPRARRRPISWVRWETAYAMRP